MEIIPAILEKTFSGLNDKLSRIRNLAPLVQIDVCDGSFVPSKTWPYSDESHFNEIAKEQEGFPFWEEIDFELDLMIADPMKNIDKWMAFGATRIIFHVESLKDVSQFIVDFRTNFITAKVSPGIGIELGIALNIDTPNEILEPLMADIDFVQFMGIAKIGYQGQKFDERVLEKIASLRRAYPDCIISVDGGVNLDSAPLLAAAGVNRLVAGSAIFESDDMKETIEEFRNI